MIDTIFAAKHGMKQAFTKRGQRLSVSVIKSRPNKVDTTSSPGDVLKPGDLVSVTGISKGKGFAGVVKRHGFAGGPKTHGQSDRLRAPGSIGQTTTPGRVYKGKRMAGRMGGERTTVKGLTVLSVSEDGTIELSGPVPGNRGSVLAIRKTGENEKFEQLHGKTEIEIDKDKGEENGSEESNK